MNVSYFQTSFDAATALDVSFLVDLSFDICNIHIDAVVQMVQA